jgi:hypothetical protein
MKLKEEPPDTFFVSAWDSVSHGVMELFKEAEHLSYRRLNKS